MSSALSVLIRHGQKEGVTGDIDPVLKSAGWLQAVKTGQHGLLRYSMILPKSEIITSPYKRTIETTLLAIAQHRPDNSITFKLDPRLSEKYDDDTCCGTPKDELLAWIKDELPLRMDEAVDYAVTQGAINALDSDHVKARISDMLANMDKSKIEHAARPDWWPQGASGTETAEEVVRRWNELKVETSPKPLVAMTHSTLMSTVFNGMNFAFNNSTQNIPPGCQWTPAHVPEGGMFALEDWSGNKVIADAFDPNELAL